MIYAIAPENCEPYLTAGKAYVVNNDDDDGSFDIIDDVGDYLCCLWTDCGHARGDWAREDRADPAPEPEETLRDRFAMAALTGLLATADLKTEDAALLAFKAADAMMEARNG